VVSLDNAPVPGLLAANASPRGRADLRIQILNDLPCLETDWRELYEEIENPSLCASFSWVSAWWHAFGKTCPNARPFVVVLRGEQDRAAAIFPFFEEDPSNPLEIRRLRLMGDLGHDAAFGMTEEPTHLVRPGMEASSLDTLALALKPEIEAGRWDLLAFRIFDDAPSCPLAAAFAGLLPKAWLKTDARTGCDFATLPDTWTDYRKLLTKSMRDNLGYYPRLLTRGGHQWQVRYIRDAADMPAAVKRLTQLHQARAESHRGLRHCNHIHGPTQEAFLADLLSALAPRDRGFIAELIVDGEIVAAQAFVEEGAELMVYYSGYREAWYKYSPIFVIDTVVFKDAMERGVRRLNFLRNTGQWKTRWGAVSGPCLRRASLVPRRPACAARYGIYFLRSAVRRHLLERLPVYRHRFLAKTKLVASRVSQERDRLVQLLFPLLPVLGRIGLRATPTLHWAVTQLPVHHR